MFTDVPIEKKYKRMNELMFTYLEMTKPGKRDQIGQSLFVVYFCI